MRNAFSFNLSCTSEKTQNTAKLIQRKNSISIHIRRGDYLNPANSSVFGNICTLSYYQKSIKWFNDSFQDISFFVFSDDITWVKENLQFPSEVYYIDWNSGNNSWEDMCLMSLCKHNIVANSTFSWWGAWLNSNPEKLVLCPPKYTNSDNGIDLFPKTWIRINS